MPDAYRPKAQSELETRFVDGQLLVHDGAHEKVHLLNAIAGRILTLSNGERTMEDIVAILVAESKADEKRVRDDVIKMLTSFAAMGLIAEGPVA